MGSVGFALNLKNDERARETRSPVFSEVEEGEIVEDIGKYGVAKSRDNSYRGRYDGSGTQPRRFAQPSNKPRPQHSRYVPWKNKNANRKKGKKPSWNKDEIPKGMTEEEWRQHQYWMNLRTPLSEADAKDGVNVDLLDIPCRVWFADL